MLEDFINAIKSKNKQSIRSKNWKNWIAQIGDIKLCEDCRKMHGKIFSISELVLPLHLYCRCVIVPMQAVASGYATMEGTAGADYWLKNYQRLPDNYISKEGALDLGWIPKEGNFDDIFPGKAIGGSVYYNRNGHLPSAAGRVWYEADINYSGGFRGVERILYSNDGLIFVTYDHYESFAEVV